MLLHALIHLSIFQVPSVKNVVLPDLIESRIVEIFGGKRCTIDERKTRIGFADHVLLDELHGRLLSLILTHCGCDTRPVVRSEIDVASQLLVLHASNTLLGM
jgi:hypothetical protein